MQIFHFLSIASLALALPSPSLKKRTAVDDAESALSTLSSTVMGDIPTIMSAITTINNSISADVIVNAEAIINANLAAIVGAVKGATNSIVGSSVGAGGGLVGALLGLTQSEADALTAAVLEAKTAISGIGATLTVAVTNLTPTVKATISTEVKALKASFEPFIGPVGLLVTAVEQASVLLGVSVTGLGPAYAGLSSAIGGVASTII